MANMLDNAGAILVSDQRQFEIRHPFAQSVNAEKPLLDGVGPVVEFQPARDDFVSQDLRRLVGWKILGKLLF